MPPRRVSFHPRGSPEPDERLPPVSHHVGNGSIAHAGSHKKGSIGATTAAWSARLTQPGSLAGVGGGGSSLDAALPRIPDRFLGGASVSDRQDVPVRRSADAAGPSSGGIRPTESATSAIHLADVKRSVSVPSARSLGSASVASERSGGGKKSGKALQMQMQFEEDRRLQLVRWFKLDKGDEPGCPALFHLFPYLALTSEAFGGPCPYVWVPDTLVIKNSRPATWFYMGEDDRVQQRDKFEINDRALLMSTFAKRRHALAEQPSLIAAVFVDYADIHSDEPNIEYFTEKDMVWFLSQRKMPNGILQQFVAPSGRKNIVLQATWCPFFFHCERMTQASIAADRSTALSLDGAAGEAASSSSGTRNWESVPITQTAKLLCERLKRICAAVATHVSSLTPNSSTIHEMKMQFKSDAEGKLWLLWCNDMTIISPEECLARRKTALRILRQASKHSRKGSVIASVAGFRNEMQTVTAEVAEQKKKKREEQAERMRQQKIQEAEAAVRLKSQMASWSASNSREAPASEPRTSGEGGLEGTEEAGEADEAGKAAEGTVGVRGKEDVSSPPPPEGEAEALDRAANDTATPEPLIDTSAEAPPEAEGGGSGGEGNSAVDLPGEDSGGYEDDDFAADECHASEPPSEQASPSALAEVHLSDIERMYAAEPELLRLGSASVQELAAEPSATDSILAMRARYDTLSSVRKVRSRYDRPQGSSMSAKRAVEARVVRHMVESAAAARHERLGRLQVLPPLLETRSSAMAEHEGPESSAAIRVKAGFAHPGPGHGGMDRSPRRMLARPPPGPEESVRPRAALA